ncbi:hypothetical protein BD414DRAFT_539931 [Trametes punicea]|nr:hypothetical protein BD414DRAFT_539931 [Trametes punicea]
MSANSPEPKESRSDDLKEAQRSLDAAARLPDPHRAGKTEEQVLGSINGASHSEALGILLNGVYSLAESLPPFVRALDAVAQIHPFLSVAVGAFRVVVELEIKRHDNDKKVNLLFLEMRNMMASLLQLKNVRENHAGRDGITISKRLEDIVQKTAGDIKECANACDTYARKRLLVKVFKSQSWDATLKAYIQRFSDRKAEFSFAISIHTGLGVDHANHKLDVLMTRMDVILEFFEKTAPREQRILADVIHKEGGSETVLAKTEVLQELLLKEQQLLTSSVPSPQNGGTGIGTTAMFTQGLTRSSHASPYFSRAAESQRSRMRLSTQTQGSYAYRQSAVQTSKPKSFGVLKVQGASRLQPNMERPISSQPPLLPRGTSWQTHHVEAGIPQYGDEDIAGKAVEVDQLMQDLADEPAVAIRKNLLWFERRFAMQQRMFIQEMKRVVVHESDRVISSVLAGPHERILDRDLSSIWQDMRWRGIVKARYLVLAIHEYYTQKLDDQQHAIASSMNPQRPVDADDAWALRYLDLKHLQRIVEAFDNDASGFVTIQEVNDFTTSRPEGWSLLRWLAYWAIGWQVAMTEYKRKICAVVARMDQICTSLRSQGAAAQDYLTDLKQLVQDFTGFFREDSEHLPLLSRFQDYVNQQEANIRERLETAKYDLDTLDTVALVNGPLGLERNVFVILYLLLRRQLNIMRLAQRVLIHPDELVDAAAAIVLVKDALIFRAQDLAGLFTQRRLQVEIEMQEFACGILLSAYGAVESPPLRLNLSINDAYDPDYGLTTDQLSEMILKYPPFREDLYPESDDCIEDEGSEVADALQPLLGHWAGIRRHEFDWAVYSRILQAQYGLYETETQVQNTTFAYDFHISPTDPNKVVAEPANVMELQYTRLLVTGEYAGTEDDGRTRYLITEARNSSNIPDRRIELVLSEDGMTLVGGQDGTFSFYSPQVVMKKGCSPELMMFYPPDLPSLRESKPEALWRFTIEAVLYDVRRRRFSWCFIKERRDRKRLLTSLLHAQAVNGALYVEELAELNRLLSMTLPADAHFFARACLEPAMFPWLLPWCQKCRRVLMTVDPCIRCALCGPATPTAGTAVFDCLACVEDHLEYSTHRILKTRVAGWTMDKLLEESGIDLAKLDELFESGMRAISNRLEGSGHFNDGFALYGSHSTLGGSQSPPGGSRFPSSLRSSPSIAHSIISMARNILRKMRVRYRR